jgi:hypothetical protein
MTEPTSFLAIILCVLFFVGFPISVLGFIRTFRAKTVSENIKAHLMSFVPILTLFLVAYLGGLIDIPNFESENFKNQPDPLKSLGNLKPLQIFFLTCAFGISFAGNTFLFHSHHKRTNKKWTTIMNPFAPVFADFNSREWLIFWGSLAAFFIFGFAALAV